MLLPVARPVYFQVRGRNTFRASWERCNEPTQLNSLHGDVYRARERSAAVPSLHRNAVRPKRKVSRVVHILGSGVKPHYTVYVELQLAEG